MRARLPVAMTGGARSRPRVGFTTPLPVGFTSDAERLDLLLTGRRTSAQVRAALEAVVPKPELGEQPLSGEGLRRPPGAEREEHVLTRPWIERRDGAGQE